MTKRAAKLNDQDTKALADLRAYAKTWRRLALGNPRSTSADLFPGLATAWLGSEMLGFPISEIRSGAVVARVSSYEIGRDMIAKVRREHDRLSASEAA